ncbi:PQQ-dependent dehydrogenase, methanol/ethanol family [Sphingopyxis bauzanensis]|uniref:PQQ-dependent dehydrogenase, methanol/ethanol family n=1 Tax=Sphingopyxis bauzanensis TaxID=651663 RepID=A0A246JPJ5_9SPHN|nr:PQQ-dependent dehydrogenase, methanol/ethanol family [Sphingopyxis bauzanensis]OWQ94732.1 PQQ-dependent dehydrogenase, methanol/ethanol family [Sphingopyxis bauzanensis]GGJ51228.1 alcohol dehydrogenase [Sphingopyxis bauzanensis]
MAKRVLKAALLSCAALALAACNASKNESITGGSLDDAEKASETLLKTGGNGDDWGAIGFNYDEQRFSPLTDISEKNVGELGIAWTADLEDARGQEATPVVVDGVMYVTHAWSKVSAWDAATGKPLWKFDPKVPGESAVNACCDVVNRGVALWGEKVFVGTIDGRLIALDRKTGTEVWSTLTVDPAKPYTITGAPRVVKDMVLIGNGGAEFGVRGYVTAYEADTGKERWRFYTAPNPTKAKDGAASDEIFATKANATWSDTGEWQTSGGGGTVWDAIVYDKDLDQVYLGVGNGNPWNHGTRSNGEGDNWFLSSIVALDASTGAYKWHYQETPGETWDYTATQPIILAEQAVNGTPTKVLYHAPKNGFFFTIDRTNGKLIDAKPFVDGINWATGYDLATGRPIENPEARFYKTGKPFIAIPGALGAHNWHPMSYNPATGLVYIPAQQIPQGYLADMNELDKRKVLGFNVGTSLTGTLLPDDKAAFRAAVAATTGRLVAFDPRTGKVAWAVDHPAAWNGGTMTTAGNLVFQGTSLGRFRAYTADTGKQLLDLDMQSGIVSAPSTFRVDGIQYVAFMTSKGGAFPLVAGVAGGATRKIPNIPRLVVLTIGGTGKLPAPPTTTTLAWDPPPMTASATQVMAGKAQFGRYCMVCHGDSAIGNGFTPDLRVSGTLANAMAWKGVVIEGALKDRGMVSFAKVLTPQDAEAIRAYVIERSNWTKANLAHSAAPMGR